MSGCIKSLTICSAAFDPAKDCFGITSLFDTGKFNNHRIIVRMENRPHWRL